jgi:hypothetical protein
LVGRRLEQSSFIIIGEYVEKSSFCSIIARAILNTPTSIVCIVGVHCTAILPIVAILNLQEWSAKLALFYAAFIVRLITSVLGDRPGMIFGAAGSLALAYFYFTCHKYRSRSPRCLYFSFRSRISGNRSDRNFADA